ncbi:MAG: TIGR04255 family protein [candidate division Zixibacteria bacterium]|nr:TIGR04255 family protein [candidate division Zixibacteria bacterium]
MSQKSRKYSNPPIIEAVCEFRLNPESKWDLTIPGILYEKVNTEFPHKETRLIQETVIKQGPEGTEQQLRTSERAVFLTQDRRIFIQIGPNLLAVNSLKPYPTWEKFKPRIENVYKALTEVMDVKSFERLGLRYINRIEIPQEPNKRFDLEKYFEFRPYLGKKLPTDLDFFSMGCVLKFFDERDLCSVRLRNAVAENKANTAFLLDMDYFLAKSSDVPASEAMNWVEMAHEKVEEIFEGCISDKLREIFMEIK